jgi:AbrB family looped-hinge helix DNA binding protein
MSVPIVDNAKVMAKGQITLPKDIRSKLRLSTGDRVTLICEEDRVILMNSAVYATKMLRQEMKGEAEKAGIQTDAQKCGREFRNPNQDHFCGEPPKTIEAYIDAQPEDVQPFLRQVRDAIRAVLPDAQERISWSMPTFWNQHNIIHFAAFKKHIGLYPGPVAIEIFADRLTEHKTSKGAVQLPYSKPLPLELIADIAKWCYETGKHH